MPILLDFSQITIASVAAGHKHFGDGLTKEAIRHMVLMMLQSYKRQFSAKYGQLIICCDGPNSWRREVFAYYKAKRRENKAKADQPINWAFVYATMEEIRLELVEYFPYKVIKQDKCEGDDVIGVLAKYFSEHEFVQEGVELSPQPVLIISSDNDFVQLQTYGNVDQWTYLFKKFVRSANPTEDLWLKIIGGDGGDGIPNAFSADDVFVTGKRQTPATEKRVQPILEKLRAGVDPHSISPELSRNNTTINLLTEIPEYIQNMILTNYHEVPKGNKTTIMNYFVKNGMKNLMEHIQNF